MFNDSYLRACMKLRIVQKLDFPFLSLGGRRHGARVWCLGRVPKHRNHWQEVLEGRKLKCTKFSGITIPRKKLLGRLKIFSKETFLTFLEQIQVSNLSIPFLPVISGRDSF